MRMTTLSKAALWQRIRALGMKSLGLLWLLWIGIQQSIHTTIQYALRHGADLGLPGNLADWSDTHALRAVMLRVMGATAVRWRAETWQNVGS